jgi:aminoglycoside N3'-acetyltransferase
LIPVFNICGKTPSIKTQWSSSIIDPFGDHSIFEELYNEYGNIILYGADFSSLTALHYVETKFGGPAYRYDKHFSGVVIDNEVHEPVTLNYHCRPLGHKLEYDFGKLESDLAREEILKYVKLPGFTMRVIDFHSMVDYMCQRLSQDFLYMLEANSCKWVSEKLEYLGRRFQLNDFEAEVE